MSSGVFTTWGQAWQAFLRDVESYGTGGVPTILTAYAAQPVGQQSGGIGLLAVQGDVQIATAYQVAGYTVQSGPPSINDIVRSPGFSTPWQSAIPTTGAPTFEQAYQAAFQGRSQLLHLPDVQQGALPAIVLAEEAVPVIAQTGRYALTLLKNAADWAVDLFLAYTNRGVPSTIVGQQSPSPTYNRNAPSAGEVLVKIVYLAQNTDVKINRAQDIFTVETMTFTNPSGSK